MSRWLFKPSRVARVRLYYSCLRGLDCIKVGRLAGRAAEKHTPSSTTHTRSTAWDPYITDSWFNVAAVKTARPQRSTGIRTYIHTVPWTFQDLLGWTLFPLLESIRDKVHTSPPRLVPSAPKKSSFLGHDKGWEERRQEDQGRFQSLVNVQIHAVSLLLSTYMPSGEISPGSSNILSFCTTHTLHFLSLTPRNDGPGRAGLSQGLPSPKPPDLCLIISSANNNHRQQPPSTTSPCRCGRKAPSHFLYDIQSLFFSSRK